MNPIDAFNEINAAKSGSGVSTEAVYAVLDEILRNVPRKYLMGMVEFAGKEPKA